VADIVPPHLTVIIERLMKKFLVTIWAYDHHAKFEVLSQDNPESLENAILDKLGENDINWEFLGNSYADKVNRITYEEVIEDDNAKTSRGPVPQEGRSGSTVEAGAS
jgi:hypothetical protein|tara:strand:- start:292 stop:612 length:321 start_codon:yes stop_codon:yes gene_type:complete